MRLAKVRQENGGERYRRDQKREVAVSAEGQAEPRKEKDERDSEPVHS